jgi:hypothetical protein
VISLSPNLKIMRFENLISKVDIRSLLRYGYEGGLGFRSLEGKKMWVLLLNLKKSLKQNKKGA